MTDADVVARAEAAVLGSLLLQPESLSQIAWLRGHDFTDPWHARVFDQLRQHRDEPITPARMGQWLLAAYPATLADLPRVHTTLQAAPLHPDPIAYARMVLEAATRRETPQYGVLLRGGALQAALTGTAHPMLAATALTQHAITGAAQRWEQAHRDDHPTRQLAFALPEPAGANVRDVLLGADRYLAVHGRLDPADVRDRETRLIASLIAHPGTAPPAWLTSETLHDRRWAATCAALLELHASGMRVDEVTVAWASEHLRVVNGPGPSIRELHDAVEDAATSDPGWWARAVAGDQLRALAERASVALTQAAANPGLTIPDLLDTAHLHTRALADLATTALPAHATLDPPGRVVPLLTRTPPSKPTVLQPLPGRAG